MSEKERLIELLDQNCGYVEEQKAEMLADYLLENGVIVSPVKVGDTVYQTDTAGRIYAGTVKNIIYDIQGPVVYAYHLRRTVCCS